MTAERLTASRDGSPVLIAHRTTMGVRPENTIVGIEAAVASGVDGVEIDLHATPRRRAGADARRLARAHDGR